jgi:hypothetical protein
MRNSQGGRVMIDDFMLEMREEILEHLADRMGHYETAGVQREIADVILAMDRLRWRFMSFIDDVAPLPDDAMQHLAEQLRDWRRDHYETLLRDWHGTAH